ncbi:hypothetical protein [Mucisphaera calidilacus]|uniref:Uncharacterized protein n=1 Tax=Mucisphaera calidilacus TaxID=2527982 RepID=A0A518BZ27_9BACT|nr:hypothetical protein [Mucisphaera calidilacus]QDU72225.1 hypothetical protein Pan265_20890 [Mucisphaera calidilacus]
MVKKASATASSSSRPRSTKYCPKVIFEGTRLVHKTDLAFALTEHPRLVGNRKYRYHTPLVSGEWCGFTDTPWGRGLINFNPDERALAMSTYETWMTLFEQMRYYAWIVDRFHVSTRVYQEREHGDRIDFGWLEERLAAVGFRMVLCHRDPDSFEAAREERLKVSGNPSQYDDLSVFVREQEAMKAVCRATRLPLLELDVSDDDVAGAAERVADWVIESGGLYPDY